jgi:hypothetical protein
VVVDGAKGIVVLDVVNNVITYVEALERPDVAALLQGQKSKSGQLAGRIASAGKPLDQHQITSLPAAGRHHVPHPGGLGAAAVAARAAEQHRHRGGHRAPPVAVS